jgi:general stress protein YciG
MDVAKRAAIASMGGKAAHAKGTAHQWDASAAQAAGRKGGLASARRKAADVAAAAGPAAE